ncbi:MAG TPA: NADP-dependent oxidoreductase [Sphingobium sp.]|uniref:NADP-dependent oxidoreductase n=1 Tax=Sphingobium sp. TaxID=1912891 RepID=UPI002ED50C59
MMHIILASIMMNVMNNQKSCHGVRTGIMKAFILDRYKRSLRFGDIPEPVFGSDDVLVDVHAAGLNPLDVKIRDGAFKPILPYRPPLVLGHDVAGTVVRVGAGVRRFKVGDEVYARPRDGRIGTFAQFIAINEVDVALKPTTLSMEEAASVPLAGLTAWQVLVERAKLKRGQKVLIHAGSGGVGIFAIQLAKHLGATVATTASTANAALVKSLGPISSSITRSRISKRSFRAMTSSSTAWTAKRSRNRWRC